MNSRHIPAELYDQVVSLVPIACVDLWVVNPRNEILLVKRLNPPCAGQWWFPGGRILHGEKREAAVLRKLSEECGLQAAGRPRDMGTFELDYEGRHAISTLYAVDVDRTHVALDDQSSAYEWKSWRGWLDDRKLTSGWIREILATGRAS